MIYEYSKVRCSFKPARSVMCNGTSGVDLIYAETKQLDYALLKNFVSAEEAHRAALFHSSEDKKTYVSCHAVLRLLISRKLGIGPLEIRFKKGRNNKPFLEGNPFHFNISHTRKAFAIAISDIYTGVDLEDINRRLVMESMMNSTFCMRERSFIKAHKAGERERFFLLWTRKEAVLKAIGTGIIHRLRKVKVSEAENVINRRIILNGEDEDKCDQLFIYSMRVSDNYLSVAIPKVADVKLLVLDENNFLSVFHETRSVTMIPFQAES